MSESFEFKTLPDVTLIKKAKLRGRIMLLLADLEACEFEATRNKGRSDGIKLELETLQAESGLTGLRYEKLCFIARTMPGRSTLDKMLLIENGVTPEIIKKSMKPGKEYVERRFKNLDKPDKEEKDNS